MPFDFARLEASRLARSGRDTTQAVTTIASGPLKDIPRKQRGYCRNGFGVYDVTGKRPVLVRATYEGTSHQLTAIDAEAMARRLTADDPSKRFEAHAIRGTWAKNRARVNRRVEKIPVVPKGWQAKR